MTATLNYLRPFTIFDLGSGFFGVPAPLTSLGIYPANGHVRCRGIIFISSPPGSAFDVRVRQSNNGTAFPHVVIVPQDLSQADFTYTWDIPILMQHIQIDVTLTAGGPAVLWRGNGQLLPG